MRVYYGVNEVLEALHGMTNVLGVYANGAYPHYEFQNATNTVGAQVRMDDLRCGVRSEFGVPWE